MKPLSEIFAEKLRYFRRSAGFTQKELGARMGYTEKAVSKWESGQTIPPVETLVKLAELFQTSMDTLLAFDRAPTHFLGIDGGATKTMFALADEEGKVVRSLLLGPCNPVDIGFEKAEQILSEGIREICRDIPCSEISLYAGISGGNAGCNEKILEEFFKRFRFASIGIGNDAENIIAAGLGDGDGIAVIMGTGSVAFSKVGERSCQYGGFGYLFDNGGNGFSLGRDAIHAALYDETGGGEHTLITKLLAERNGRSSNDMITEYYGKGKSYIASFSGIVLEAYDKGDAVAGKILAANMKEIANLIDTALEDFAGEEKPVKVVFVGGLTARAGTLFPMIEEKLKNPGKVNLSVYPYEPVLGALKRAGAKVDLSHNNGINRY